MATDPAEPFEKIPANMPKPVLPDPSQAHIADHELTELTLADAKGEHSKIPDASQVKQKVSHSDISAAHNIVSSSEDEDADEEEDDYSSAYEDDSTPRIRECPEHNRRNTRKAAEDNSSPDYVPSCLIYPAGLNTDDMQAFKPPTHDVDGNKTTGHFCLFSHVVSFPYRYMRDPLTEVAKRFFVASKLYEREWDLYYVHPPASMYRKPTVLLPLNQVRDLLDEIRSAFDITVQLSLAPFTMSFFNDKTPQPVFLGETRSREEYNNLVSTIPAAEAGHGECPKQASHQVRRAFEDFGDKFPKTRRRGGGGKGGQKGTSKQVQKGKEKPVAVWKASLGNLLQTQRYFGLRPEIKEMAPSAESLPQQDQQKWAAEDAQFSDTVFPPFDVCAPSPHPFEKEVVLIAFDVEAYERAHHMITEVGVSTLDTKDIMNISPGPGGENWIKQIRSRHFRIEEYKHLRNKDFVSGNPDGFEFGESEFISLKSGEAVTEVDRCFMFPFSAGFQHDGTGRAQTHEHPDPLGPADRHIVLVGHNTQGDIEYLSKLGSKIFASSQGQSPAVAKHPVLDSIADTLDIDKLYKDLKKEANIRKLGSIVSDLGRAPWGLHNGGNDARYTMECLIGLAIKARLEDDEKLKQAADKEADVAKAQFLDPARTYATASSSAGPGRGHHYGSDNELDDCSGDKDVEEDYESDESSDFVM